MKLNTALQMRRDILGYTDASEGLVIHTNRSCFEASVVIEGKKKKIPFKVESLF